MLLCKRTFTVGICLVLLAGCGSRVTKGPSLGLEAITPDLIHRHVFYLASDSLKGRNTPSPELDIAAGYVARQFALSGLKPVGGSYMQKVHLNIVSLGDSNSLSITQGKNDVSVPLKSGFVPFDMTANKSVRGEVVFAGYGISAPEFHYDDYASIDAKGKIVFVLRHEPGEEDPASIFDGKSATGYSSVPTKVRIAIEHGAIGVLVATDPLNHTSLTPRGFPWPSLSKLLPKDALPITLAANEESKVPVVHVGEEVIAALFGSVDSLRNLEAMIDKEVKPRSFPFADVHASVRTSTEIQKMSASNVVGWVEGVDSLLKNELIVIGAHYDHLGYLKNQAAGQDSIFNGADDNASGTSAMMAIAAGFGAAEERPRRSVLFVAFAGEEKGLLGSEFYIRHPLFSLEKTVAMLNLDMVGRNSIDSVYVMGGRWSPDLIRVNDAENQLVGFVVLHQELNDGGSDHMSFLKRNIPALFYHSGLHPDYHKVSDHADLINTRKVARVAKLAFLTAWQLANEDRHYQFIPSPVSLF